MKKLYKAPLLECLAFFPSSPISAEDDWPLTDSNGSHAWNDGELGWT